MIGRPINSVFPRNCAPFNRASKRHGEEAACRSLPSNFPSNVAGVWPLIEYQWSFCESNCAETSWQMKIKFIHGRPGCPMRMGNFFGAFEEIPAPHLSGNAFQFSRKRLKQAEWDEKLQCPDGGLRNLLLNDGWKRCA